MALAQTPATTALRPASGLDRPGSVEAQDNLDGDRGGARHGRLRLRTLVTMRWLVVALEAVLLGAAMSLGFEIPYVLAFGVVGVAAWANLLTRLGSPGHRLCHLWEATLQLAFDILQIAVLIHLTGGTANPFILLLIAPVTLAAATLPLRPVLILGGLAIAATLVLAVVYRPLPSADHLALDPAVSYRLGSAIAIVAGIGLIAGYVRQAAAESARMALALDVTHAVLAREQRLSALGTLAAAAAHELGTPLATIAIVAKEMAREAATPSVKEDAELLVAQAARCREILQRLTETPDASDEVHERMSLLQLVHEVIEPHADTPDLRVEAIVAGAPGVKAPDIWRRPEILHAMTSFVENAVDFAKSEVLIIARFDAEKVSVEVRDDGRGFAPEVLAKLGEPYVTTRPGAEGSRSGHIGMGLGFFIAKTLLERTGAVVSFQNARPHGAVVLARWARERIEVKTG